MSCKLTFVTKKTFNDGTEILSLKNGYKPNPEKVKRAKRIKKLQKEIEFDRLKKAYSRQLTVENYQYTEADFEKRLQELQSRYAPKMENAIRAMSRSKQQLMDVLKSNDFVFFVTLTFDKNRIDRLDDNATRKAFRRWAQHVKEDFPQMRYVAVEEYHKKGGLHFHLLLGDITAQELKLTDSGKRVKSGKCAGEAIYNIKRWRLGWSTATEVKDKNAVKNYLAKYLTKGKVDPRFFGKKRFYTSQNINRPTVEKSQVIATNISYDGLSGFNVDYEDKKREYIVLSRQQTTQSED